MLSCVTTGCKACKPEEPPADVQVAQMRKERAEEQAEVKALAASYDRAVEQAQEQHGAALRDVQRRQEVQLTAVQEQLKAQVSPCVAFVPPLGWSLPWLLDCQKFEPFERMQAADRKGCSCN